MTVRGDAPAVLGYSGPWGDHDHAELRAARDRAPVACGPAGWVFLRHRDCAALLRDRRLREPGVEALRLLGIDAGPVFEWWSAIMFNQDGEDHRRLRSLVGQAFTPRTVEEFRPSSAAIVERLCAAARARGEFDLVGDIARSVPLLSICHLLRIPSGDIDRFGGWAAELIELFALLRIRQPVTAKRRAALEAAITGFDGYVTALIADRRGRDGTDLLSELIRAGEGGDRLSQRELVAMVSNLILGGTDTTTFLISNAMRTLLRDGRLWVMLRDDPHLAASVVEETLRFEPPVPDSGRVATEPLEVSGLHIEEGEFISLSVLSANRDPDVFDEPDRFDPLRDDRRHLAFGGGIHFCLGAALARLNAQETVAGVARHLPGLRLRTGTDPWSSRGQFRGVTALPARCERG